MKRLILNEGYGVQFDGEYHKNGHPVKIAEVNDSNDPQIFHDRANIVREMVDLWNAKHATK